jgi:hypothetical protein
VDVIATLGRMLGFSFAAGLNLYATVAILGLASRFQWVQLPPQFKVFDNNLIIGVALILYVVEFLADKIPWIDTLWDGFHTVIRPLGGALIAVASLGPSTPIVEALVALLGAAVAGSSHLAKAGTRVVANTSPEPFSNWFLSLGEDTLVVAIGVLALRHPVATLCLVVVLLGAIAATAGLLIRAVRQGLRRRRQAATGATGQGAAGST